MVRISLIKVMLFGSLYASQGQSISVRTVGLPVHYNAERTKTVP